MERGSFAMLNHMATYIAELYQEVTGTVDKETTAEKHDTNTDIFIQYGFGAVEEDPDTIIGTACVHVRFSTTTEDHNELEREALNNAPNIADVEKYFGYVPVCNHWYVYEILDEKDL